MTLLETRDRVHVAEGVDLTPACGSRAKVRGYQHRADGRLPVQEADVRRLCARCVTRLGLEVVRGDASSTRWARWTTTTEARN